MQITKEHEERRSEILDVAEMFFCTKGYSKTTVNDILQSIGIAKGTFYYYFKSKEEVMDAIVMRIVNAGVVAANAIASDQTLTVHEKILQIIMAQKPKGENTEQMIEQLHQVDNAQMHQKSLVEIVTHLSPILTEVIEQGIDEGVFNTPYPRETTEILLVTSQFLFDDGIFNWQPHEIMQKVQAFIHTIEITLGAEKGSFAYMVKVFDQIQNQENE